MFFLRTKNGQPSFLIYTMAVSLVLWLGLIVSSFHIKNGAATISILVAKIAFVVHAITLLLFSYILWKVGKEERSSMIWLFCISIWLFLVDLAFYVAAYANHTYLMRMSFFQFFLYYAPCIIYCLAMIIFLARTLIKRVLDLRHFLKIIGILLAINIVTVGLFFSAIHYAFGVISWESISQMSMLGTEMILFDFAIVGLICANNLSVFLLLMGTIFLIMGDFFLTYSSISQTVALFSYGSLFWLLGLLFILFSVVSIIQNHHYSIKSWFRAGNGIQSRLGIWSVGTSISGFLLFFVIAYVFLIVDKQIFVGLPLFVMLYSIIAVTFSILMGRSFEAPFNKLINNVQVFMNEHRKENLDKNFSITEFVFLNKFVIEAIEAVEERDQAKKHLGEISAQVAHDIRSPLSALNTCLKMLPHIPEEQRILMRNAANRINDIAHNLLVQYKGLPTNRLETYKIWLLAPLMESIISEKRLALEGRSIKIESDITAEGVAAFAEFDSNEMKRVLSNLINNALEAFPDKKSGSIIISLDANRDTIRMEVIDNGIGIPPENLTRILESGGMSTKEKGSGLGLSHAKETIESWKGEIALSSILGKGTKVSLTLPRAPAPRWFVSKIELPEHGQIGVLDDDQSVHDAWNQRLLAVSKNLHIEHFTNSEAFIAWYEKQPQPPQVFSDYELLGDYLSGLEVLEQLKLGKNAILVTSHYESPDIIERCQKNGIRLLPKNLLAYVPIVKKDPATERENILQEVYDLILLDDNLNVTRMWELAASMTGKKIRVFNLVADFEEALPAIELTTPIYIDSELGDGLRGEIYAREIFERGFKILYLATGYEASKFGELPWITAIVGKDAPFI